MSGINKVIYGNNTLIDLTEDTVNSNNLLLGETAHNASGDPITGALITHNVIDNLTSTSSEDALSAKQGKVLNDTKQQILWKGTRAEYEAQKSQIPNGTEVYITDDVGEAFTSWGNIIGDIEDQEDLMDALNSKGGGGSIVRVTFDASQAGRTITFSMTGMETKTETVPAVDPYVIEISTMELGDLTITDTVTSRSMVVNIETYTLYSIVFVTGFILQDWLDAGGVVGTYSDLNAVFADEKAVRRLMTVHAAVDYLVSVCETDVDNNVVTIINNDICAKWINLRDYALDTLYSNEYIASEMDTADKYFYGEWIEKDGVWQPKGNVPVMTSNSAPYGTCFGSNISSVSPAYYAFDNNDNTRCETTGLNVTSGQYVGYTFVNPVKIKRALVTTYKDQNSTSPYTIKFQASNDGFVNEIVDVSDSIVVINDTDKKKVVCNLNATKYYSSYRLYYESYTGIYNGQYYFNVVGLNFFGRELSVSVPKMTSNTAPWGEAIKDSEYDGSGYYSAYKAFNKANASSLDCWSPASVTTDYHYIGYDFTKKTLIKNFSITNRNTIAQEVFPIGSFIFQGSDDGSIWEDIHEYSNTTTGGNATSYYDVTEKTPYKMYRIRSYGYYCVGELQLFGLDYSEREFAPGSTMKYIYDHCVEVEEINIYGAGTYGSATKKSYSIELKDTSASGKVVAYSPSIDITPYKLLRTKICESISVLTNSFMGVSATSSGSSTAERYFTLDCAPNNEFVDIENITQSLLCIIAPANTANQGTVTFNEWWLE